MATAIQIPCCLCGTLILPNNANQCSSCLAQEFDLQGQLKGNKPELLVHQCRQCRRYQQQFAKTSSAANNNKYAYRDMEWESPELLALCLKSIPGLQNHGAAESSSNLQLLDAMWVWTEPHSRRLKVRLTIRTEIHGVVIQQRVMVELKIQWLQCPGCKREYTNRTWHALVQVRQKRDQINHNESNALGKSGYHNKSGLAKLEMGIFNNPKIRKHVLQIDTTKNGFDFYFLQLNQAQAFANFLCKIVPMKITTATSKLVSTDSKNNTANVKHTLTCDLVPICKHDLVCVSKKTASSSGGGSPLSGKLALVTNITSCIHMIDASPKRNVYEINTIMTELPPDTYFRMDKLAMPVLLSSHRMIRFVVLDVELLNSDDSGGQYHENDVATGGPLTPSSYALAEIEVARESDFGTNDEMFSCVSHLGKILQVGDIVLGYDLINSVLSEEVENGNMLQSNYVLPDIILVKKCKPEKQMNKKKNKGKNLTTTEAQSPQEGTGGLDGDDFVDTTSKKGRRQARKAKKKKGKRGGGGETKRRQHMIDSAERMGFMDDYAEFKAVNETHEDGDDDVDDDDQLRLDPHLLADLDALENDLQQKANLNTNFNTDGNNNDGTNQQENSQYKQDQENERPSAGPQEIETQKQ